MKRSIKDIINIINDIEYGFVDKYNVIHKDDNMYNYMLQRPKEVLKNKVGLCWDQVELERYLFKGWNIKTFYIQDIDVSSTHTFLVYKTNNKWYWFEHSWELYRGIHEYESLDLLLEDVISKFKKDKEVEIKEYNKPNYHINSDIFIKHCIGR